LCRLEASLDIIFLTAGGRVHLPIRRRVRKRFPFFSSISKSNFFWVFILGLPAAGAVGYQLSADWGSGPNVLLAPKARMISVVHFNF